MIFMAMVIGLLLFCIAAVVWAVRLWLHQRRQITALEAMWSLTADEHWIVEHGETRFGPEPRR